MAQQQLRAGDPAPPIIVIDTNDVPRTLDGTFWAEGPVLLTFLRHFG